MLGYYLMNTKNFSIFMAGFVWLLVAWRIGLRGFSWIQPYIEKPDWHLSLLLVSVLIGVLKATTVLRKAAQRNLANVDKISNNPINYFVGWLILYNVKGVVFISLMIGLGYGLRYLRSLGADPYNLFGFLYLGIALAIGAASFYYFASLKKAN